MATGDARFVATSGSPFAPPEAPFAPPEAPLPPPEEPVEAPTDVPEIVKTIQTTVRNYFFFFYQSNVY